VETVIVSIIIISIILFGALTMGHSYLSAQDTILVSWQEMQARTEEMARTDLSLVGAVTKSAGAIVEITLRNKGDTRLADFKRWDVVVQYYTASGGYVIKWLPYTPATDPGDNQWTVTGIYLDAAAGTVEVFEPGILDPGEEMVIRMRVSPPVGPATTNLATITTINGISLLVTFSG